MRRLTIFALSLSISSAWSGAVAVGQETLLPVAGEASTVPSGAAESDLRFEATLRAFENTLAEAAAYEATAETRWEAEQQGQTSSGATSSRLTVQNPNWLALSIAAQGGEGANYRVVANGAYILREMSGRKAYSLDPLVGDPRIGIEADGMTLPALRSAGIDFLLRSDLHGALAAQTLRATQGPSVERDGQRLQLWTLTLTDGAVVELFFTTGSRVVPVERNSVVTVPLAGGSAFTMRTSTKLRWNLDARPATETFATTPSAGFERVFDLTGRAATGGDRLTGHAAPGAAWRAMDGSIVSLGDLKGHTPVVLLFWATWAAPSAEAMPDLRNYAAEFSKKGVRIVALNVGETPDQIDAFVQRIGYDGELGLDSRAETMAAFGLESTPSVVLIDRQGVVRGVWQGLEGDAKKKIFEATVAMLQAEATAAGGGR
jgi:peroxiredoxin